MTREPIALRKPADGHTGDRKADTPAKLVNVPKEAALEPEDKTIELSVSDHAEIGALYDRLRQVPDVAVKRTTKRPTDGELGVLDVLTAVGSLGGLISALGMIPAYLQARRPGLAVKVKIKDKEIEITAANAKQAAETIEKLLDD